VDLAVDTMMAQELTGARPKCVLLAEDDPYMRQLLASALRKDGYEVIEAKDGIECLGCMQSWVFDHAAPTLPDIIISDIRMPGWSGLEILQIARAKDPCVPVILITAFGAREIHNEAWRLGAAAVFDKPFDVDDLRELVLKTVPPR